MKTSTPKEVSTLKEVSISSMRKTKLSHRTLTGDDTSISDSSQSCSKNKKDVHLSLIKSVAILDQAQTSFCAHNFGAKANNLLCTKFDELIHNKQLRTRILQLYAPHHTQKNNANRLSSTIVSNGVFPSDFLGIETMPFLWQSLLTERKHKFIEMANLWRKIATNSIALKMPASKKILIMSFLLEAERLSITQFAVESWIEITTSPCKTMRIITNQLTGEHLHTSKWARSYDKAK